MAAPAGRAEESGACPVKATERRHATLGSGDGGTTGQRCIRGALHAAALPRSLSHTARVEEGSGKRCASPSPEGAQNNMPQSRLCARVRTPRGARGWSGPGRGGKTWEEGGSRAGELWYTTTAGAPRDTGAACTRSPRKAPRGRAAGAAAAHAPVRGGNPACGAAIAAQAARPQGHATLVVKRRCARQMLRAHKDRYWMD
ncbi:MAG: hypothetical protein J3K34DRAFT_431530 [Monoraphidium minutum]|nr:MAG: hypothetical protein J3K34DRAFT_431530 [Monoraphidium minutum]